MTDLPKFPRPFEPQAKLTRAQRRALEDGASRRRDALERAQAAESLYVARATGDQVREDAAHALLATAPKVRTGPLPVIGFVTATLAAACAAGFGVLLGAPVLGHDLRPTSLGVGLGGAVLLWWVGHSGSKRLQLRARTAVWGAAVLLLAGFVVGAVTSVTIDGKVYLGWSSTAKAHNLIIQMRQDIYTMAAQDPLLSYDDATARVHYNDYTGAQTVLDNISTRYAASATGGISDPQLAAIAAKLESAAHEGSLAMDGRQKLIVSPDTQVQAQVTTLHQAFDQQTQDAATALSQISGQYGVTMGQEGGNS